MLICYLVGAVLLGALQICLLSLRLFEFISWPWLVILLPSVVPSVLFVVIFYLAVWWEK